MVRFYRPSHIRPILTPGIRICSVNLRSIFRQATATFLRSKYYRMSNFQNMKSVNLNVDSKSLEKKTIKKSVFLFLKFWVKQSKLASNIQNRVKLLFCLSSTVSTSFWSIMLTMFLSKFFTQFFPRILNLQSDWQISNFENLTLYNILTWKI